MLRVPRGAAAMMKDNRFIEAVRLKDMLIDQQARVTVMTKGLVDRPTADSSEMLELAAAVLLAERMERAWRHSIYGEANREVPVADGEAGKAVYALGEMFLRQIQSMAGISTGHDHLPGDVTFDLYWSPDYESWVLTIYEITSELVGGAEDGQQLYSGFSIEDMSGLLVLLDPDDEFARPQIGFNTEVGSDPDGPAITITGKFKGQCVHIAILLQAQEATGGAESDS